MNTKTFSIVAIIILALLGVSYFSDDVQGLMLRADPPRTVDHVDVNLYIG